MKFITNIKNYILEKYYNIRRFVYNIKNKKTSNIDEINNDTFNYD